MMGFSHDPVYQRRHRLVSATRGQAARYGCVDCNNQADQWSQKFNGDPDNVMDYDPRCPSCHSKYDRINGSKHGHQKLTEQDIIDIRTKCANGTWTQAQAADFYGVRRPTIHKIVNRHTWAWIKQEVIA